MGSSLLKRNILDNLELLKITHQYQDIIYYAGDDLVKLKIDYNLNFIEYKLLLNDKLLFLKQEGKNINKEEYHILDGCIYNNLNEDCNLIYKQNNDLQINTVDALLEIFKINSLLEDVIDSSEDEYLNKKIKIKTEI